MVKKNKKLLFGSFNPNKAREMQEILSLGLGESFISEIELHDCSQFPTLREAIENGTTAEENALIKARTYFQITGIPCFADDTVLEVESLGGKPGIDTAHYAGIPPNPAHNMALLLQELAGAENRNATFRTVIAFVPHVDIAHIFVGSLKGSIAQTRIGTQGFGYDPIFIPAGDTRTLAQYSAEEKNRISHRKKALAHFIHFLKKQYINL